MRLSILILSAVLLLSAQVQAEENSPDNSLAEYLGITQLSIRHEITNKNHKHFTLVLKVLGGEASSVLDETEVSCASDDSVNHVQCLIQLPQSTSLLGKAFDKPLPARLSLEMVEGTKENSSNGSCGGYMELPKTYFDPPNSGFLSGNLDADDSKISVLPSGAKVVPLHYSVYCKMGQNCKGGGSIEALRRNNPGAIILLAYLVMDEKPIQDVFGDFEALADAK